MPKNAKMNANIGVAELTLPITEGSKLKNRLKSGMQAMTATSADPTMPPALIKFCIVRFNASVRAGLDFLSNIRGTKDCAVKLRASQIGMKQQKNENKICCAAISKVPSVLEAT
mmetsp:Transcript_19417/g.27448  ORF Transcript_19417/g.27448 Transcript_19417/m.27448 type:complete len:114 (-) Transcript_19417:1310-1651(-)